MSNARIKVEYLIDIVSRDMPIAAAMYRAGEPDLSIAISPTFVADGEKRWSLLRSLYHNADILITPWYNATRTLEILARSRLTGGRLVHYPSEQFFGADFDAEKLNVNCAEAYRRHVDAVLVWGEYYARRLVNEVGYPRERIYEVGSPRLEFARLEKDLNRKPGPLRVLFISDFTLADLQSRNQRAHFSRTYGVPITAEAVRQLDDERRYMLETAKRLACMNDIEVRIRPHPGEQLTNYRAACTDNTLQYASPAEPFTHDVHWADVVVGYTSTSIFEVTAAGRPFLALRRHSSPPETVRREGLESLYRILSMEELIQILKDSDMLDEVQQQIVNEASFYIGNINGSYHSTIAINSSIRHISERKSESILEYGDWLALSWGTVRSTYKYLALRLFASDAWCRLGLWQPEPVRCRLTPGHKLTDSIIKEYLNQSVENTAKKSQAATELEWKLGPWCWQPVEVH